MSFWLEELDDLWTLCHIGIALDQLCAVLLQSFDTVDTLIRPFLLKGPLYICGWEDHDTLLALCIGVKI